MVSDEIRHFMDLALPYIVFCDRDRVDNFKTAVKETNSSNLTIVIGDDIQCLKSFYDGHDDDVKSFW